MAKVNKAHRRREQAESRLVRPLIEALGNRAMVLTSKHGHDVQGFVAAKKKFGKGAHRGWCEKCGCVVLLLPFHSHSQALPQVPAISGEILFTKCTPTS